MRAIEKKSETHVGQMHYILCQACYLQGVEDCKTLLKLVTNSKLCDGLPQDEITKSVVVDQLNCWVVQHSIPKCISERNFQASVYFGSPGCEVTIVTGSATDQPCNPCAKSLSTLEKAARRKKTCNLMWVTRCTIFLLHR